MLFSGDVQAPKIIHLYHYDNHYCVITSMAAFFSRGYFCEHCDVSYNDKEWHKCKTKCSMCYHSPPCKTINIVACDKCNSVFKSQKCFENHKRMYAQKPTEKDSIGSKKKGRKRGATNSSDVPAAKKVKTTDPVHTGISICDRFKRCNTCYMHMAVDKMKKHKCGYMKCKTCKSEVKAKGK